MPRFLKLGSYFLLAAGAWIAAPGAAQTTAPATQEGANSFPPGKLTFDPAGAREIPIKFGPHGLPMVQALLNGKEVPLWVLDTGAGAMVITPKTSGLAGIAGKGTIDAAGAGGSVERGTRKGGVLTVGAMSLADCTWVELPELDGPFSQLAFGEPIAGIIGRDLFVGGIVELDWANARLILHDPAAPPALPEGARWMELQMINDLPTVRCRYEGDHEGMFMIDTGHDGGVQFEGAAVERNKLLENRKTTGGGLAGIGGASKRVSGTIGWFELAGVRHTDLPAGFATQSRANAPNRDGIIGMTLLKKYRIILDAGRNRAAFLPTGG